MITIMFNIGCIISTGDSANMMKKKFELKEAIEKAKMELKKLGFDIDKMRITADENNTAWKDYTKKIPSVLESDNIKKMKLNEKEFWVIQFSLKEPTFGGGALVFIDISDGSTIGIILGE